MIELVLIERFGPTLAFRVLPLLGKRSVRSRLLSRAGRRVDLTRGERVALKRMLATPESWAELLDPDPNALSTLSHRIRAQVYALTPDEEADERATEVSRAMRGEAVGALNMADALQAVSYVVHRTYAGTATAVEGIARNQALLEQIHDEQVRDQKPTPSGYAILAGPLETLGLSERLTEATELATTAPEQAVNVFDELIARLNNAGYAPLSTSLLIQKAQALTSGGEVARAAEVWSDLVLDEVQSGRRSNAREGINALLSLAAQTDAPRWVGPRGKLLDALSSWAGDPSMAATQVVSLATDCQTAGDPRLTLLLALSGEVARPRRATSKLWRNCSRSLVARAWRT